MKRVIIAHGWDGHPKEGWFPWLKNELEVKGFEVIIPQLPNPEEPRIQNWVPALAKVVGTPDSDTYFICHSMGGQTVARYLEGLPEDVKIGGVIFVASFFKRLTGLESDEELDVEKHWIETPLDLSKVKTHIGKSTALFSDDDPFVPLDNIDDFKDKLGSEIIIEKGKSHFNTSAGFFELPIVLEKLLEISG